jgi:hypothetical protein
MATNIVSLAAPTATAPDAPAVSPIQIPDVAPVVKVAAWKTADGAYHENIETARETMTRRLFLDFAALNGITDMSEMASAMATHLPALRARVDAALK